MPTLSEARHCEAEGIAVLRFLIEVSARGSCSGNRYFLDPVDRLVQRALRFNRSSTRELFAGGSSPFPQRSFGFVGLSTAGLLCVLKRDGLIETP